MSSNDEHYDPAQHEPLPEGEESAPPFMKTMATVRWALLIGLSLFALIMVLNYFDLTPWQARGEGSTQYHCPMHPTYVSNQPGDCPICGMTLVPIGGKADTEAMTDSVQMDKMNEYEKAGPKVYTCPMHPEVISDKPGKCPKCGMDLVPSEEISSEGQMGDMGKAPVPGLVPVTIEPERLQLIGVRTAKVERRSPDGKINIVGFVAPDETRIGNVHFRVTGWVSDLFVDKTGQFVKAGQPLMSIYSQELYQAKQDYVASINANTNLDSSSNKSVNSQIAGGARERLKLLGLTEADITDLEKSDLSSPQMTIRSPFSGYVLEKSVLPGQLVSPDQNLFTIADLSRVWVWGDVYEQDIQDIHVGQNAKMRSASYPADAFEGKIEFIFPSVSEKTRTMRVRLSFPNASLKLLPGMYVEVEVQRDAEEVLVAPVEAILDGGDRQYAFVVHSKIHFEPRLVTVGKSSDDWIEILGGLEEGEEVVTSANFLIDSESRLKSAISGMGSAMDKKDQMPAGHIH